MMKSQENAQKPVFPAYFRHFRPEKKFLQNRTRILDIAILRLCAKFHEKI